MVLFSLMLASSLAAAVPARAQGARRAVEPAEPDLSAPAVKRRAPAKAVPPPPGSARRLWLSAYDDKGRRLDHRDLLRHIGRADGRENRPSAASEVLGAADDRAGSSPAPVAAYAADGQDRASKFELLPAAGGTVLVWEGPERVQVSLPWPVREDGFSTVWIDKGGEGYADRDTVLLNEEIALTQNRRLHDTLLWKREQARPAYEPGEKAEKLLARADELLDEAGKEKDPAARAKAFDEALAAASIAWQKADYEHGLQTVSAAPSKDALRFGLTFDESADTWSPNAKWLAEAVERSGANWVRLVFRANPHDFAYGEEGSFAPYDTLVSELTLRGIKVMACVLDTAQWPRTLTPETYAARVENLVRRYGDRVRSWEVGAEINGDWLGGSKAPLGAKRVFEIYSAGVQAVKAVDPKLETVATLYWWDGTAPDAEHSLFGWLDRYVPLGFGKDLDVVSLSLQPEDNPVGMAFDGIFRRVHEALPDKKLMLGSYGYVEGDKVGGYWWLDPKDVDGARKDLVLLYNGASCGQPSSLCGGFWWQTLDQMFLPSQRTTDLFQVYKRGLGQLNR